MKKVLIIIAIVALILFVMTGHRKRILYEPKDMLDTVTNNYTKWFFVYYEWNDKRDDDPWWIIFKRNGKVHLVQLSKVKSMTKDEFEKATINLTKEWIDNKKFVPNVRATRWEILATFIGADPIFQKEKDILYQILEEMKNINDNYG